MKGNLFLNVNQTLYLEVIQSFNSGEGRQRDINLILMEFIIFLEEFIRVTGLLRTERMNNVTAEVMSQSDKVPNPRMIQCLGIY